MALLTLPALEISPLESRSLLPHPSYMLPREEPQGLPTSVNQASQLGRITHTAMFRRHSSIILQHTQFTSRPALAWARAFPVGQASTIWRLRYHNRNGSECSAEWTDSSDCIHRHARWPEPYSACWKHHVTCFRSDNITYSRTAANKFASDFPPPTSNSGSGFTRMFDDFGYTCSTTANHLPISSSARDDDSRSSASAATNDSQINTSTSHNDSSSSVSVTTKHNRTTVTRPCQRTFNYSLTRTSHTTLLYPIKPNISRTLPASIILGSPTTITRTASLSVRCLIARDHDRNI